MMPPFDINNWYWIVDDSTIEVYSSLAGAYVSVTDATYIAWRNAGHKPAHIIGNDILVIRIKILEDSITERMTQEAISGSVNTFPFGPHQGQTSAQAIASIVTAKNALRAQMT